ncbi:hypothetical protein KAI30_01320, partial [Candidatus Bathyarchaeota archaeon]|nr:hypothetical protein [Candidatus Bathyarchaeota archaeon]
DRALEIKPQRVNGWFSKGLAEDKLGRSRDAAKSYRKFIELAPSQYAKEVEYARQWLRKARVL